MTETGDGAAARTQAAAPRGTMRRVVYDRYGGPEVLRVEEAAVPEPGRTDVLVRVEAAAVDRGTWHLLRGVPLLMRPVTGLRGPRTRVPGRDLAGTVAAVGSGATRFAAGDRVVGTAAGALAEFVLASERTLAHAPRGLTPAQAAALPVSGLTALQAVHDAGRIRAGQTVLVLGASGGVGTFAVQMAVAAGARVTASCGPARAAAVGALGAHAVVDRTRDDALAAGPFDLIVDIAGDPSLRRLLRALTPRGTAVIVGSRGRGPWTCGIGRAVRAAVVSPFLRKRLVMLVSRERAADLERLGAMVDAGDVVPRVDAVLPIDRASEALRRLDEGDVCGKLVIAVAAEPTAAVPTPEGTGPRA